MSCRPCSRLTAFIIRILAETLQSPYSVGTHQVGSKFLDDELSLLADEFLLAFRLSRSYEYVDEEAVVAGRVHVHIVDIVRFVSVLVAAHVDLYYRIAVEVAFDGELISALPLLRSSTNVRP